MEQNKKAIKNLIESSARIFVAAEPSVDEATMFSALALKKILEDAGKYVFLYPKPSAEFAEKFSKILPPETNYDLPQKIKIKVPKNYPIDELQYEDEDGFLNIVILPKGNINTDELLIEKSPYEMDAAFCFFDNNAQNEEEWKKITAPVERPAGDKTIYFTENKKTMAEKINESYEALKDGPAPMPSQTATLLFASLAYETENFTKNQTQETFGLAKFLLEAGADKEALREAASKEKKPNTVRLLGRALARTTLEEDTKIAWTFLAKQDFIKTGLEETKENILFILRRVRAEIRPSECSVVCFEKADGVAALLFHENKGVLGSLSMALGATPESRYFFTPDFKNFSDAENRIRELIKREISDKM